MQRRRALDQPIEVGMQLRRAAGQIQRLDLRMRGQDLRNPLDAFTGQRLGARRRGIDMAMPARLVAQLGQVDLERVDAQRRQADAALAEGSREAVARSSRLGRHYDQRDDGVHAI